MYLYVVGTILLRKLRACSPISKAQAELAVESDVASGFLTDKKNTEVVAAHLSNYRRSCRSGELKRDVATLEEGEGNEYRSRVVGCAISCACLRNENHALVHQDEKAALVVQVVECLSICGHQDVRDGRGRAVSLFVKVEHDTGNSLVRNARACGCALLQRSTPVDVLDDALAPNTRALSDSLSNETNAPSVRDLAGRPVRRRLVHVDVVELELCATRSGRATPNPWSSPRRNHDGAGALHRASGRDSSCRALAAACPRAAGRHLAE